MSFKRDSQHINEKHRNRDATYQPQIDPNSDEIVRGTDLNGMAVVERLELAELQKQEKLR